MSGRDDDWNAAPCRAHAREHAEAVEIRHHQIEDHAVDARTVACEQHPDRRLAAFRRHSLVAEAGDQVLDQPALHGIIVDDEDSFGHGAFVTACPDLGHSGGGSLNAS